jgi:hypothetical protein
MCRTCLNCVSIRRFEIEGHPGNGNQERRVSRRQAAQPSPLTPKPDSIRLLHCRQGGKRIVNGFFDLSKSNEACL